MSKAGGQQTSTVDTEVVWGDPPDRRTQVRKIDVSASLEMLRERPRQWARIYLSGRGASQSAKKLAEGLADGTWPGASADGGKFEVERRSVPDGTVTRPSRPNQQTAVYRYGVWARWVPEVKHPGGSPRNVGFLCDFCDEQLSTPGSLKVHVKRHHPEQVAA